MMQYGEKCKNAHILTPANTYKVRGGDGNLSLRCRECHVLRNRAYRQQQKARFASRLKAEAVA